MAEKSEQEIDHTIVRNIPRLAKYGVLTVRPGYEITAGTVRLRGEDVTAWPTDVRAKAGMFLAFQEPEAIAGVPVTPAIDNLTFAAAPSPGPGAPGLEQMIASTGRALLLTCLWYIREVDPQTLLLTGLTRDGVYLVEDGEVTGQVNNFRFNESPVGMLGRLLEVGATVPTLPREWGDYFNRAAMPPVRVEGFNMSSVSKAS